MGRHYYQFGPYRLDPLARTLLRDNEAVELTPKAVETLRVLVEQAGQVVSKEQMLSEVWPYTFVEEGVLARNICDLRRVLRGFDDGEPIQTIPRRGYRFAVPVLQRDENLVDGRKKLLVQPIKVLDSFEDPAIGSRIYEAMISRLAVMSAFRVQAETSADATSTKRNDSPDLAAVYILQGSLQKQDGTLRLSVRLEEKTSRETVWADNLEEKSTNLFSIEDSLAEEVAGALGLVLSTEQPKMLSRRYTESRAAYGLYLRGRYHWNQRSESETRRAIRYFRQSLSEDPRFAPAYSALSSSYSFLPMLSSVRPHSLMPKARAAAVSALQIDETLAEARAALAFIKWHYEWNWHEAEREYRRIIRFQPDHAIAHQWYALMLAEMGRSADAVRHAAIASELDPSPAIRANQATVLHFAERYLEAIEVASDVLAIQPSSLRARLTLGLAFQQIGRYEDAIREMQQVFRQAHDMPLICGALGNAYASTGRTADARKMLHHLEHLPRGRTDFASQAFVQIAMNNDAGAFECLKKACEEREFVLVVLGVDRRFAHLRADPKFQTVLDRIGLP